MNSKYFKICIWLIIIALALIVKGVCVAGQTGPPHDVPPGLSMLPPGNPNVTRPSVELCITVGGLNNPNQQLTYMWDESVDNGLTWHPWTGADMIGGLHHDKSGKPTTRFCSLTHSPTVTNENSLVRLRTYIVGPGLTIAQEANDQ